MPQDDPSQKYSRHEELGHVPAMQLAAGTGLISRRLLQCQAPALLLQKADASQKHSVNITGGEQASCRNMSASCAVFLFY